MKGKKKFCRDLAMKRVAGVNFFMTDGAVEGADTVKLTRSLGSKARSKRIVVNTVALKEPKANAGVKELAKTTGVQFTIVEKSGMVHVVHSSSSPSTANSGTREHGAPGRCRLALRA